MLIVPLQAVPTQSLNIVLNSQPCVINLNARTGNIRTNLFLDLYVSGSLIIGGVVCLQGARIVRDQYLTYVGDLVFNDSQPNPITGPADPFWQGLASRFQLIYLFPSELSPVSV